LTEFKLLELIFTSDRAGKDAQEATFPVPGGTPLIVETPVSAPEAPKDTLGAKISRGCPATPDRVERLIKALPSALIVLIAGYRDQSVMLEMFAVVATGMPFKRSSAPTPEAVVKMFPSKLIDPETIAEGVVILVFAVRVETIKSGGMTAVPDE
jgi:hypothetical protein